MGASMLRSAEIKLGHTPDGMQKLRIVYMSGRILERIFGREIYLHEGYGIYVPGCHLNDYADIGLYGSSHIRSYVRLDFMDFLFFYLNLLGEREGKIRLQIRGRFKLLVSSRNPDVPLIEEVNSQQAWMTLQIKFPALFNKDCVKLRADFSETNFKRSCEDYWVDFMEEFKECNLLHPIEPKRGNWCDLKPIEASYLFKAIGNYSLRGLFKILTEMSPVRNNFEYLAGVDIPRYKEDRKRKLLSSIVEFEKRFASKRARRKLRKLKNRILNQGETGSLTEVVEKTEEKKLREYERDVEFLYISRGARDNPISESKPKKQIKFKLWERDLADLFTGNYSGTCIALDERKVMPLYLQDPYTEFFRILVNERRMGHVKMFYCLDEDGENVLHIDYIGLSGGRFESLQDEIKMYAITASIRFAQMMNLKRVYVAREIILRLDTHPVRNRLVKKGPDVYSQYLDAAKFLVWEAKDETTTRS